VRAANALDSLVGHHEAFLLQQFFHKRRQLIARLPAVGRFAVFLRGRLQVADNAVEEAVGLFLWVWIASRRTSCAAESAAMLLSALMGVTEVVVVAVAETGRAAAAELELEDVDI
jgi:transposase-like protein